MAALGAALCLGTGCAREQLETAHDASLDSGEPDEGCVPDPTRPRRDADGDGLTDLEEVVLGTDACAWDTDGDAQPDLTEALAGTDPRDAASGIAGPTVELETGAPTSLSIELTVRVRPLDVAFVVDTSRSSWVAFSGASNAIIGTAMAMGAAAPDARFGLASFEDYRYGSMGTTGDLPYRQHVELAERSRLYEALPQSLEVHDGGDLQESSVEALYQALTGAGYDMNCNGALDPETDVPPGGLGFHPDRMPLLVYLTDAPMRDPELAGSTTPGGCPGDAGAVSLWEILARSQGRLMALLPSDDGELVEQAAYLAGRSRSLADVSGDRLAEPMIVPWAGGTQETVDLARGALHASGALGFAELNLAVVHDPLGLVERIEPTTYYDLVPDVPARPLPFEITLAPAPPGVEPGTHHVVHLVLTADGGTFVDEVAITADLPP